MAFGRQEIVRAAAVLIMSGALVGTTPAFAAAPALSVTPSTGLSHGQSVAVTGTGFPAGDAVAALQCDVPADLARISCDFADNAQTTTDSEGGFSAPLTVRARFDGVNPITGAPAGHVDCTVAPGCGVLAGSLATPEVFAGPVPVSFASSAR